MRSVSGTHSGSRWIKRKSVFRPMAAPTAMGFSLALPGFQGRAVEVVGVDSHGVRAQPVDPDAHAAAHGRHVQLAAPKYHEGGGMAPVAG